MSWTDYASAPAPGTPVCPMPATDGATCLTLAGPQGSFPILLVVRDGKAAAFVNACPHQYLPLDHRGPRVLSADGQRLMCTNHGASFDAATGAALAGAPCGLDPVPLTLRDGHLHIAG